MNNAEIRELKTSDLKERVQTEKDNYARMKLDHVVSPVENTSKIKAARKGIARMLTELRIREINEQK